MDSKKIKLYTRNGDRGNSTLVGGAKTKKDSLRVCTYGDIDELNSVLGIVRTKAVLAKNTALSSITASIQNDLFDLGSEIANPKINENEIISEKTIKKIEDWIDDAEEKTPPITNFVLPGGTEINSFLHLARTVCRRAERSLVSFRSQSNDFGIGLAYLNRLSDLLFALSRKDIFDSGEEEFFWVSSK